MAQVADEVVVNVTARTQQAQANLRQYAQGFERSMTQSDQALQRHERQVRASAGAIGSLLRGMTAGLAAGVSVGAIVQMADAYTSLQSRLRATGLEGANLLRVQDALYEAANRNGIAVDSVAQLYQRLSLSQKALGASQEELLSITDGVAAALRVQGVSAQQASGPLLQLGQALGAGTVRAEELNSLLEGTPVLLQAAANGSEKFAGDMNALTRAVRDGKVSSQELFRALLQGLPELERQAASLPKTVGQALQVLNNELGRYVGQTDQSLSATERLAQGIEALANNLDRIVPVISTLAIYFGTRWAAALAVTGVQMGVNAVATARYQLALMGLMARQTGATTAQVAFNAALAANPIGLAVTAVAALAAGLYVLSRRYSDAAELQRQQATVTDQTKTALDRYRDAAIKAAQATGENAKQARANAEAMRIEALQAVRSADALRVRRLQLLADRTVEAQGAADRVRSAVGQAQTPLAQGQYAAAMARVQTAQKAYDEALKTATTAKSELDQLEADIRSGAILGGGGGGTTTTTGGRSSASDAQRIADMRERISLEERLAFVRAIGDAAAIRAEEERQRLIELTNRYREAGYEDAASRALAMLAMENEAVRLDEERERLAKERRDGLDREVDARRRAADWTERQYAAEMEMARIRGDDRVIKALEREAELRRRIAEYTERYGAVVGTGLALTEQMQVDRSRGDAEAAQRLEDNARNAARHFVDVLASDNIWEAAGAKFREAAFNGLEDFFTNLFRQMGSGEGGGLFGSIARGVGGFFGGARAMGGPVTAGRAYVVGERRPEVFVPNQSGRILPNTNALTRSMNVGGGGGAQPVIVTINLDGANGDEAIRRIAYEATSQGVARGMAMSQAQARKNFPNVMQRYDSLGTT